MIPTQGKEAPGTGAGAEVQANSEANIAGKAGADGFTKIYFTLYISLYPASQLRLAGLLNSALPFIASRAGYHISG